MRMAAVTGASTRGRMALGAAVFIAVLLGLVEVSSTGIDRCVHDRSEVGSARRAVTERDCDDRGAPSPSQAALLHASYTDPHAPRFPQVAGAHRSMSAPEPGTLLLLGAGLITLARMKWGRSSRR